MRDRPLMAEAARAVIFDLDGVITSTASVHAAAWQRTFDEFLRARAVEHHEPFRPFDPDEDYHRSVDGKLRQDGVRDFLASRGIVIPEGAPDDPPERDTVHALGNRKNALFLDALTSERAQTFPGTLAFIEQLRARGVPMAVVSASRNAREILRGIGLLDSFYAIVDGTDAESLGLPGKPDPALFIEAARRLGIEPAASVVIEDAISGVEAGCAGGFGLVIGIDRSGHAAELHAAGADQVLSDLSEIDLTMLGLTVGWQTLFEGFDPATEGQREALCALGNGYFVTRGAVPEAQIGGPFYPATYIAGIFNRPTGGAGQRETDTETIVNVPNWLSFRFRIADGDWFDLQAMSILSQRHELEIRTGTLVRHLRFRDDAGRVTRVTQRRFVSMTDEHLAGLESTFLAENWSGELVVESALDGRVSNCNVERYRSFEPSHLLPVGAHSDEEVIQLVMRTPQSHIRIAEAARTRIANHGAHTRTTVTESGFIGHCFTIPMEPGRAVTVEKIVAIYTSKDGAVSEPAEAAVLDATRAPAFADLLMRHELAWHHLWRRSRIEFNSDHEDASLILDLHQFHLLQTVSENSVELDAGVPARGLHGEGYRGHVFWDELMIFPFLNLRFPELTRALLLYRYRRLRHARWAAADAGHAGAMFPWQSGSDGRDETPRLLFNPRSGRWMPDNSRLQRHVGIAVAYNVWLYYQVTGDTEFMSFYGAELIIEIARFFASLAEYSRTRDRYEIRGVMGPDEYHDGYPDREGPGVDNNAYTNIMTAWLLTRALDAVQVLPERERERLFDRLSLRQEEIHRWEEIARKIYVPVSPDGIIWQFEGYDGLEEFDWAAYRERYGHIERLDLILEAEEDSPNRYKLSKQPDVLMLFYLLSGSELRTTFERLGYPFDEDTIPKNIEYYEARTAHGSTLSRVVTAWVLSRVNRLDSWNLFRTALLSDVEDIQGGTTREGIHLGAMAGTVDLVQRCYTGIETRDDVLWFDPMLPAELQAIRFDVHYRHHWVEVEVLPDHVRLATRKVDAAPIKVGYRGDVVELRGGESHEFAIGQS